MTQEEILKAIVTTDGGQLSAEDAQAFIDETKEQSEFLKKINVVTMVSDTYNIDTIGVKNRILREAVEATAPTNTNKATIKRRKLEYKEVILPYDVSFSFLEQNITKEQADAKLQTMFTKQFGNDNLDMGINGDETLPETITDGDGDGLDDTTKLSQDDTDFIRINNGWVKLALLDTATHKVTFDANDGTQKKRLAKVMKAMPNKWKANKKDLCFLMSPNDYEEYQDEIGNIAADAGIQQLLTGKDVQYKGITIEAVAYVPDGTIVMTLYANLYMGIGRNITVGKQVQQRPRLIEYTITAKTDFNYAVSDCIVVGKKAA